MNTPLSYELPIPQGFGLVRHRTRKVWTLLQKLVETLSRDTEHFRCLRRPDHLDVTIPESENSN